MTAQRIGLLISGGIVLVVAIAVVIGLLPAGVGSPTNATTAAGRLDPITLDIDPAKLVTIPTGGKGAEDFYNQAVAKAVGSGTWLDFPDFYNKVNSTDNPRSDPTFSAILAALDAGSAKPMADGDLIFPALPVNAWNDFRVCDDILYSIGKMGGMAARADRDAGDKDKARKTLESVFIFGWRLWHNGPYRAYRQGGLRVMSEATASLASLLKDMKDPKADVAQHFEDAVDQQTGPKWMDKEKVTIRDAKVAPGDLANLALHDKDRTWRIEGVLWLGVAKWTAAGGKQREAIQKFLEAQAHTTADKLYAQTAAQAAAFSEIDNNQMRAD